MKKTYPFFEENLSKLKLDVKNPRFAELYNGSTKEDDLIEYLLYTESADEIAKDIIEVGQFYQDRPLWVLKDGNNFLVKDGNRRCAAVKALQFPTKYGLALDKFKLKKLPILIYNNKKDLEERILKEHTASLFREWDRIAKALKVHTLYNSGSSVDSMTEIDSNPSDLIKLASFYYAAVKIEKDDLKKLLRRGRKGTGGKTIIFERLFKFKELCGYNFKNKPSYEIIISDKTVFTKYISSMVSFLKKYPETTHKTIDFEGEDFLVRLKEFGFVPQKDKQKAKKPKNKKYNLFNNKNYKKILKTAPNYERKLIPAPLMRLINECYKLDFENFSNAKIALARVSFECTLKYIIENTKYAKKKELAKSNFFKSAFFNNKGKKRIFTDFTELKNKFTELILDVGKKQAFKNFNLDQMHPIIHNYNIGAIPADARAIHENLTVLLDFMLQEKKELLNSLNLTKL